MFLDEAALKGITWQGFERLVSRLLVVRGFEGVRQVGQSSDGGADVIAHRGGHRWLFQVKRWGRPVSTDTVDATLAALKLYKARVPVVVSVSGFTSDALKQRQILLSERIPLQLWDRSRLLEMGSEATSRLASKQEFDRRQYQEMAIEQLTEAIIMGVNQRALVVMATGLGKTYVAAEAIRRSRATKKLRVLAIAHTNPLVYQLEKAFWATLSPMESTVVWNGLESPPAEMIESRDNVFACIDTLANAVERGEGPWAFDVVIVDECHHAGTKMYNSVLGDLRAGEVGGPFLLGLTATPWRPDGIDLERDFGKPLVSVDLVTGMKKGFLANVDYRMYTDNIDWNRLKDLKGKRLSPRSINRTLFIDEWDDAVVRALQLAWLEQANPRCIVFCGTIDHALRMTDKINALGFTSAAAIFSGNSAVQAMSPWARNRVLCDFDAGELGVVCAVDIFNEGVDVPDVNIIVFQRVTHSRRIFVQQLGRGLRLSPGKEKTIVLDFVSDIRRFAAGLALKAGLTDVSKAPSRVKLNNTVNFVKATGGDPAGESFLREWMEDVAAVEQAGEDVAILKYPPDFESVRS